jgi:hypothetical protein
MIGKYPRACNHFALNKFSSVKLREWESLVQVIRDMQKGIFLDPECLVHLPNSISDLPTLTSNGKSTTSMHNVHGDNFNGDKIQYNNTGSGPMINGASGPISFGGK